MTPLQPSEYDASYFDGSEQALAHNAGYSYYKRWFRNKGENSLGEHWKDYASRLTDTHRFIGKDLLDIGCAKGFLVESMRDLGVNAFGLDVSPYAIGEADPAVQPYLTVGDMKTVLPTYGRNEFDFVTVIQTLECFDPTDLPDIITEINRICRKAVIVVSETGNSDYYIIQPKEWWEALDFAKGTIIISSETKEFIVK